MFYVIPKEGLSYYSRRSRRLQLRFENVHILAIYLVIPKI